jgi:transcriptional regulator with XRE-family HTH domain
MNDIQQEVKPRDPFVIALGRKLKLTRSLRGMNQDEVAAGLGLTRAAYSHFERGVNLIGLDYFIKLPKILNCGIFDILPDAYIPDRDRAGQSEDPRLRQITALWGLLPEFLKDGITGMIERYVSTSEQ